MQAGPVAESSAHSGARPRPICERAVVTACSQVAWPHQYALRHMETADGVRSIDGTSINDLSDRPPARETPSMLVGVPSDRCSSCGAELAVDQRYCVACGQRRGKPRFNLATPTPTPT